jgi:hypothetical protein
MVIAVMMGLANVMKGFTVTAAQVNMITCQWLFLVVVLILLTKAFLNYN